MKLTEEELIELFRNQTTKPGTDSRSTPDADTMADSALGTLDRSKRLALADALAADPELAEQYRLVRSLRPWASRAAPGSTETSTAGRASGRRSLVRWSWTAAAAAAVLMVAVLVIPTREGTIDPIDTGAAPVTRSGSEPSPVSAVALLEPVEGAVGLPARFRWVPLAGAETYRVSVFREDGTPLWSSPALQEAMAEAPDAAILTAGIFYWQVRAFASGGIVAESRLTSFQVR